MCSFSITFSFMRWMVSSGTWIHCRADYHAPGYGGLYFMDDANVPSLLSLPYLGFLEVDHPAYVATRQSLLSRQNPYYAAGKNFSGVRWASNTFKCCILVWLQNSSGPHVDAWNPWFAWVVFVKCRFWYFLEGPCLRYLRFSVLTMMRRFWTLSTWLSTWVQLFHGQINGWL